MCGRFSDKYTWKELHDLYSVVVDGPEIEEWNPKYNIAPTTKVPLIRLMDGKRQLDLARWGLVPSWAKEIGKFSTFNARSDGVASKPTFRGAWKAGHRCIIPATSFFEWRKSDKQPFAIGLGNKGPMAFAGLWDEATIDGSTLLSCTIITTEANKLMAPIHDRMPVILGDEDMSVWLGEEKTTPAQTEKLLAPFPASRMSAWTVSKDVGSVKNQGPHLVEEQS